MSYETHYYFSFIKPRLLNTLSKAQYHPRYSPHQVQAPGNFLSRLTLNTILVGEYISEIAIIDHLCCTLEDYDELFRYNKHYLSGSVSLKCISIISCYSMLKCHQLLHRHTEFYLEIKNSLVELDLPPSDLTSMGEEAADAFDFLLEMCSLLPSSGYALLIISSKKQLTFNRFIPAPSSINR